MGRHARSMNCGSPWLFALLVLLAGACESPPVAPMEAPFIAEYSTERLRIATDFPAELCAGNIALMDAQVRWMEQHIDGQRAEPIWVYLYTDGETISSCPNPEGGVALGCWAAPVVHTTWEAVSHELVHAYFSEINDLPPIVLQEGVAVALAGGRLWSNANNREHVGSFLLDDFPLSVVLYQSGGHLVRYLFGDRGWERTLELYGRMTRGMDDAEISEVFQDVFGATLNETLAIYAASTKDNYPSTGPFACGQGERVEWSGNRAAWTGKIECTDSHTIGEYRGDGKVKLWRRWRVEITEAGIYDVQTLGQSIAMTHCLTEPTDDIDLSEPSEDGVHEEWTSFSPLSRPSRISDGPIMLQSGVYEFWLERDSDAQNQSFYVAIQRQ